MDLRTLYEGRSVPLTKSAVDFANEAVHNILTYQDNWAKSNNSEVPVAFYPDSPWEYSGDRGHVPWGGASSASGGLAAIIHDDSDEEWYVDMGPSVTGSAVSIWPPSEDFANFFMRIWLDINNARIEGKRNTNWVTDGFDRNLISSKKLRQVILHEITHGFDKGVQREKRALVDATGHRSRKPSGIQLRLLQRPDGDRAKLARGEGADGKPLKRLHQTVATHNEIPTELNANMSSVAYERISSYIDDGLSKQQAIDKIRTLAPQDRMEKGFFNNRKRHRRYLSTMLDVVDRLYGA